MKLIQAKYSMLLTILVLLFVYTKCESYSARRTKILQLESWLSLGGNTSLSKKESIVNDCLMKHKIQEVDYGFRHPANYTFAQHFFNYKHRIPESKVFQIIKAMPKGAVLHIHDMGILGPDYILNITYMNHLYVCLGKKILFLFSKNIPITPCDDRWQLMTDARQLTKNITHFDSEIRKLFTLVVDNPNVIYPSIRESWNLFLNYFTTALPLLTYKPVWEQYFYDSLSAFRDDNVMYVEVRSLLPNLYELDGKYYDYKMTAQTYRNAIVRFVTEHPDFFGAKIIFAPLRHVSKHTLEQYLKMAKEVRRSVTDIFAGFDLVGPEELGGALVDFVPVLDPIKDMNFFFHAGETNWYGTLTDENLIDAVLLGAKRIGHAYALVKHPVCMKRVIVDDIGLEVSVVSNTVLSLVKDVRNHPLSVFLSLGLPVVLSSDDPGIWESEPLSDDFYVAFVAVASKLADLRMLRALALNSIKYSALDPFSKQKAFRVFSSKWNRFVDTFNCSLY